MQKLTIQTSAEKFHDTDSEDEHNDDDDDKIEGKAKNRPSTISLAESRAEAYKSLKEMLNRQSTDSSSSSFFINKLNDATTKKSTVVNKRFVVKNITEKEHLLQQQHNNESRSLDTDEECSKTTGRLFENVKNIDLVSKSSDSERNSTKSCTSADSKSSFMYELKKNKEIMLENMRKSDARSLKSSEDEMDENRTDTWSNKVLKSLEILKTMKNDVIEEHQQELKLYKAELDAKLEETKKHFEEKFNDQKLSLEADMQDKLNRLRKEMEEKEEDEMQKLVANMEEVRVEKLKKVKNELEACYEKERLEMLDSLKGELERNKRDFLELRSQEMSKLETEQLNDEKISESELTRQNSERIESLKRELDKEFNNFRADLRLQQREKIMKIKENHEQCLADVLRDFKTDVGRFFLMFLTKF